MVAVQPRIAVQGQRDVAEVAAARDAAGATVDGRRDSTAVQEQNRLASLLLQTRELGEEWRRERIPGFATEIDDLDDG